MKLPYCFYEKKIEMTANQPVLSNLQRALLKLYANGVSDKQLLEIKWMLVQYFADKATEAMDKVWEEKQLRQSKENN